MLIACYQCRQQLETPDDSAGKRVRCPHCQYVIVVPAKRVEAAADGIQAPLTALPNLDLDAEKDRPIAETKVPAQPLPPLHVPPPPVAKKTPPPLEEAPEPPPIERGSRRRRQAEPEVAKRAMPWGRVLLIGGLAAVIAVSVTVVVVSMNTSRRVQPKVAFMPPRPPVNIAPAPAPPPFNPNFMQPPVQLAVTQWHTYRDAERRFKVDLPGNPFGNDKEAFKGGRRDINFVPMTVVEGRDGQWACFVAHHDMSERQFRAVPLAERFRNLQQGLCDSLRAVSRSENVVNLAGNHVGREWELGLPDGTRSFVQAYFILDGDRCHHYVLSAKGPLNFGRQHADFNRFFASFGVIVGSGHTVYEETDDLNAGGRSDNEFTALALHPTRPVVVLGTAAADVIVQANDDAAGKRLWVLTLTSGKPVEQLAVSKDGQWLAAAAGGEIHLQHDWDNDIAFKRFQIPGLRCVFTKHQKLIVASANEIKIYDRDNAKLVSTFKVDAPAVRGLALSADEHTLAIHGDKTITLWQWPENKLLGRIDAHAERITTIAFSPDGKTLASASADRTIKLWNVETRAEQATLKGHAWTVWSLAFTPDGKRLASGGLDGMFLLWDLEPEEPQLIVAQAHQFPVRSIAFAGDGKHCYLTCKNAVPNPTRVSQYQRQLRKIGDADLKPNPREAEKILAQRAGLHLPTSFRSVHLGPDGRTIVTTGDAMMNVPGSAVGRIWDSATATVQHTFPGVHSGALSPDGKWFVAFRNPGLQAFVQLFNVETRQVRAESLRVDSALMPPAFFTPDGKSLWVLQKHELLRCDIPTLAVKQRLELKKPNDLRLISVNASADRKTFLVDRFPAVGGVHTRTLHASADGRELPMPKPAAGEWSGYLRLRRAGGAWAQAVELEDQQSGISQTIGQQRGALTAMVIHPEGRIAAGADFANDRPLAVNFWDLAERRPILALPEPGSRTLYGVQFSPDGRLFASMSSAGWTRIVPTDWLLERKALLPVNPQEVAAP